MADLIKRSIFLFFIALATIVQPARACSSPPLRVALFNFPPYYYLDAAGTPQGELVTLLNRVTAEAGCHWEHLYFDRASRLLEKLTTGEADLALIIHHPIMEKRARYGTKPLTQLRLNSYHFTDVPPIKTPKELHGKRLIVLRGYGYGGLIKTLLDPDNGITLLVGNNHREAFELLEQGHGDYLLDYQGPATKTLKAMGLQQVSSTTLRSEPLFFVLSPQLANHERLLLKLENALATVQKQTVRPEHPVTQ